MCPGRIGLLALTLATLNACRAPAAARRSNECPPGLAVRFGACVSPAVGAALCGPRRVSTPGGCAPKPPCEAGRARDLATGECFAHRESRAIAASVGVLVDDETLLECEGEGTLASGVVNDAPRLGCLPQGPAPLLICPPGAVALPACTPIRDKNGMVDVVTWTRAVLGDGTSPFCAALREGPGTLVVAAAVENTVHVELSFPDNDVSQVVVSVRGRGESGGPAAASQGELDHTVAPFVEALRSLGGSANQAFVGVTVSCRRTSERPRAISTR